MMRVRDFVADLARAGKGYLEKKKKTVEMVYGDKALKKMTIYAGKNTEDQHHLNPKKSYLFTIVYVFWASP
jgi:hypothetical protein